jgi:hypothetical protein
MEDNHEESQEGLERLRELEVEVRDLSYRLGRSEARVELTEKAESTMQAERERSIADLERERERADRLQAQLDSEQNKGIFRRLFGGSGSPTCPMPAGGWGSATSRKMKHARRSRSRTPSTPATSGAPWRRGPSPAGGSLQRWFTIVAQKTSAWW